MTTKNYIYLLLFLVILEKVNCAQMPENVATVEGNTITMILETGSTSYVSWLEYVTKTSGTNIYVDGSYVYSGDQERGKRYSQADVNSGSTVLHKFTISNIALLDGGKYGAQNPYEKDGYAQLIVLKDDIQCSISPNPVGFGSVAKIDCAITYQGKWAPVMSCSSTELSSTSLTDASTTGNAAISFSGTTPSGIPDIKVSCEAHFANPASAAEVGQDEALNVPSYTSEWTGHVNVLFPATAITITPEQSVFDVNDVIKCTATGGNPEPTYRWINIDTAGVLSRTSELLVSDDMAGMVLYVKCTATSTVNGVDYEIKTEKTFSVKKPVIPKTTVIIIAVPTVMGLLGLLVAVLVIVYCKKKEKVQDKSDERNCTKN